MSLVSYEMINEIGVIRLNNPPVNALSHRVRENMVNTINAAQNDASKALLLVCEGRTFIAGADITEFGKAPQQPVLSEVLAVIENSAKPVLSAIHGTALGGGFELALCCHYRCALTSARLGLPEVKLGLLPGAGGTRRLPRLAGVDIALDMMTSGRPISAGKALNANVIDKVFDGDLLEGALAYASELIDSNAPLKRVRDISIDAATVPDGFFEGWRQKLAKRARGQIAPGFIVSCVEAAVNLSLDQGLAKERELFLECMRSPQSTAMRHLFFAQRKAAKVKDISKDTAIRPVRSVAIVGAGTMGGGIAMKFANAAIPVTLLEINDEALQRGLGTIRKNYHNTVRKGRMSKADMHARLGLIIGTTSHDDLAMADLVIEAVFENLDLKKEVFTKLDRICKPGAILATNTSYQDVNQIAAATQRPQDVIGLHFFSPANVMKLLEVVGGDKTAKDVIATCMKMAKTIKKIPVLAGLCYGFIGNRMLRFYGRQAQLCLIEGASPEQIDRAMQNFGMAMGPLAVGDLAGLDIGYMARKALSDEEKGDPRSYCIPDALVEMGRLGQKSWSCYYKYDPETRARLNDPIVMKVVEERAAAQGVIRRRIDDEEILNRLNFALINEAARILEEGIARRAGDIDVVYVFGYGFPAARGGPMHYADSIGLKKVYNTICQFRDLHGEALWTPAPLFEKLAVEGKRFSDWTA